MIENPKKMRDLGQWINANVTRNDKSIALFNIAESTAAFLDIAALGTTSHISVLALATRNLFELNIRLRNILHCDEKFKRWLGEAAIDKISTLEGLKKLNSAVGYSVARDRVEIEINRLKELQKKYEFRENDNPSMRDLANDVGLQNEYDGLYKLFSKIVHPSSYLINSFNEVSNIDMIGLLQTHAQLYFWDTYSKLVKEYSIPETVHE